MKGGDKISTQENLKSLKVFSKKLKEAIDVFPTESKLMPAIVNASWLDKGWNNSYGSWQDSGWNNSYGSWVDKGWNNSYGGWSDSGWNNSYGGWSDSGWSNSGGGGGCYITTATVEHLGLGDDCEELNLLRKYRDELAEKDPEFRKVVLEYYKTAPQIVEKISNSPDKEQVLNGIYNNMVLPVLKLLKAGKLEEAKSHYINAYNDLKAKYVLEPQKKLVKTL